VSAACYQVSGRKSNARVMLILMQQFSNPCGAELVESMLDWRPEVNKAALLCKKSAKAARRPP
jgi:uncharacterized protein YciU (UPF0263 family)